MIEEKEVPLFERVTYRLSRVQAKLNAQARRLLKAVADLSLTEWRVLIMLDEYEGVTMAEIGRRTEFDKGQLSRCIKVMSERGLLTSASSEADQRLQILRMTAEGRRRYELARPYMLQRQNMLLEVMTAEQRATLNAALEALENAAETRIGG